MRKLYLSDTNKKIAGVCGGVGEFFNVDPTIVRVLYIIFVVLSFGLAIFAYLAMWAVIPRRPKLSDPKGEGI